MIVQFSYSVCNLVFFVIYAFHRKIAYFKFDQILQLFFLRTLLSGFKLSRWILKSNSRNKNQFFRFWFHVRLLCTICNWFELELSLSSNKLEHWSTRIFLLLVSKWVKMEDKKSHFFIFISVSCLESFFLKFFQSLSPRSSEFIGYRIKGLILWHINAYCGAAAVHEILFYPSCTAAIAANTWQTTFQLVYCGLCTAACVLRQPQLTVVGRI